MAMPHSVGPASPLRASVPLPSSPMHSGRYPVSTTQGAGPSAGAVLASRYKADKADMMDMAVSWNLCALDTKSLGALWLRRLETGRYEVDGRQVSLQWRNPRSTDIVVCDQGVADKTPLPEYLRQVADTAKRRNASQPQEVGLATYAADSDTRPTLQPSHQAALRMVPPDCSDNQYVSPKLGLAASPTPSRSDPDSPIRMQSVWSAINGDDRIMQMHRACREADFGLRFDV